MMTMVTDPDMFAVVTKADEYGLDVLSGQERQQYVAFAQSSLRNHFVAHELMASGLLQAAQGQTFEAALRRGVERSRGMRDLWELRRNEFSESFRLKVDALVQDAQPATSDAVE